MRKIVKLLLSGESFFVLFLFSGAFKELFSGFPIDLTVLFMGITILVSLKKLNAKSSFKKASMPAFIMFCVFLLIILLSSFYTLSDSYYVEKTLKFMVFTTWSFVCPLILMDTKVAVERFIRTLMILSVISALLIVRNYFTNTTGNTNFVGLVGGGASYLSSARFVGSGSIALLVLFLYKTTVKKNHRFLLLASLVVSLLALLTTGARMPVIAFFLTFLILALFNMRVIKNKIMMKKGTNRLMGLILLMMPAFYFIKDLPFAKTFLNRIEVLLDDGGVSALGRINRFNAALDMMKGNILFGGGFGSFGINYDGFDGRSYPHNLLLEVGAELGLIGLLIMVSLILYVSASMVKNMSKESYIIECIFGLFIFHFINAMVSGDLNDNRVFFAFLGMAVQSKIYINSTNQDEELKTPIPSL